LSLRPERVERRTCRRSSMPADSPYRIWHRPSSVHCRSARRNCCGRIISPAFCAAHRPSRTTQTRLYLHLTVGGHYRPSVNTKPCRVGRAPVLKLPFYSRARALCRSICWGMPVRPGAILPSAKPSTPATHALCYGAAIRGSYQGTYPDGGVTASGVLAPAWLPQLHWRRRRGWKSGVWPRCWARSSRCIDRQRITGRKKRPPTIGATSVLGATPQNRAPPGSTQWAAGRALLQQRSLSLSGKSDRRPF
jgi:hypothetical protein